MHPALVEEGGVGLLDNTTCRRSITTLLLDCTTYVRIDLIDQLHDVRWQATNLPATREAGVFTSRSLNFPWQSADKSELNCWLIQ